MLMNFNIGFLGHVDSGKTSLAKELSSITSTAAFDKNPQSQERGITLDLGFSGLLIDVPEQFSKKFGENKIEKLQYTFVDCPGHASLIRTIMGGAQIIDLMLLVIDAQKGIQTQTAECIVIGELLKRQLIVVVNKIDLIDENKRETYLEKLNSRLRKTLEKTAFGKNIPIYNVSALHHLNIDKLLNGIIEKTHIPERNIEKPLLIYVDHCFSIKGQGTVCTGTVVQGFVNINQQVEIPTIREQRKVKSIQMFRKSVQEARMGDRIGLCVTQFNANQLERGAITEPGYFQDIYAACVSVNHIQYYKSQIKSKSKLHITVGHETIMGCITLFSSLNTDCNERFDLSREYRYVESLENDEYAKKSHMFALIEFDRPLLTCPDATLIASKLDMDTNCNQCRLAFWGNIEWYSQSKNYATECLPEFKIFKEKTKQGSIQRVTNSGEIIVQNLFKKENRDVFIGKIIELSTGEIGIIDGTFGQTSKVKISFRNGLKDTTIDLLKDGHMKDVKVILKYKNYVFNKTKNVIQ